MSAADKLIPYPRTSAQVKPRVTALTLLLELREQWDHEGYGLACSGDFQRARAMQRVAREFAEAWDILLQR